MVVVGDAVLEGAGDGPGVHELGELLQLLREAQLRLCRVVSGLHNYIYNYIIIYITFI